MWHEEDYILLEHWMKDEAIRLPYIERSPPSKLEKYKILSIPSKKGTHFFRNVCCSEEILTKNTKSA